MVPDTVPFRRSLCVKPVGKFKEMNVDAAGVTPVHSGVGEMLKMVAYSKRSGETTGRAERPHKLKRPAEVLTIKLIFGDQGSPHPHINGYQPVLSTKQHIEWYQREDPRHFVTPDEHACRKQGARSENPFGPDFFLPGKPCGQRNVGLVKIDWLIMSNHKAGKASSQGQIFEPQLFSPN